MKSNNAAIYLRLSKEDSDFHESRSIENQRKLLMRCLNEHGFTFFREYIDDGYSGTDMERPGLKKLLFDIDQGLVGIVLTKDLSRLGRNSGRVQTLLDEFFASRSVRYIALTDGIDTMSENTASLLTPILSFTKNTDYLGKVFC